VGARSATLDAARATKALRRAEATAKRAEWQLQQSEQWARSGSERALKAKAAAQEAFATAQSQFDRVKAEMQPKVDQAAKLRDEAKAAAQANTTAQEEAKAAARKLAPISVFISRATQRIYVRQAREPLFDMPITIAGADRPLGTYVFTAVNYTAGEADLRWSLVSMYGAKSGPGNAARKRDRQAGPVVADQAGAKAALDRIAIPAEALERISELVAPGTSLIVSDEALSRETGAATDFIVLMSGEPQGGIRIRRRPGGEPRMRYQRPPSSSPFGGTWSSPSPFFFW
jgi:multidrug efflux pump subunit AcrA (membrane-fusion protein)